MTPVLYPESLQIYNQCRAFYYFNYRNDNLIHYYNTQ